MSANGLGLDVNAQAPLGARGADRFTRADMAARAEALVRDFTVRGVTRALVCSDDPVDLLRAIGAADLAGADLFIAHTNLPPATIDEIAATHSVQARIGAEDVFVNVPP